jgi:hypothetical protein
MVDFRPVIEYGNYPVAIMSGTSLPAKTLAEFVAFSKTTDNGVLVGIPGAGSVSHIYGQLLQQKTGARLTFIPYRGDAPARLDLLAGNIQAIAATPDFGLIAEGKARLIGYRDKALAPGPGRSHIRLMAYQAHGPKGSNHQVARINKSRQGPTTNCGGATTGRRNRNADMRGAQFYRRCRARMTYSTRTSTSVAMC